MKTIDKHIIRDILDEMHIASSFDEDGDLMIVQQADEDFVYDVAIYILVNDNRLSFLAAAQGYEPQGNLLELANRHNCQIGRAAAKTCPQLSYATEMCAWNTATCSTKK